MGWVGCRLCQGMRRGRSRASEEGEMSGGSVDREKKKKGEIGFTYTKVSMTLFRGYGGS